MQDKVFPTDPHPIEPANGLERLMFWIGRLVARVESNLSSATTAVTAPTRNSERARVTIGEDFDLVEILPSDPPVLRKTDVFNVLCFDLDTFTITEAVNWIHSARRTADGALPRFVVLGPSRALATEELREIAHEVAPVAVFFSRPRGANFTEALQELGSQIKRVSDPKRLLSYNNPQMSLSATDLGVLASRP